MRIGPMISGFLRPTRSTNQSVYGTDGNRSRLTDKLDEYPDYYYLPSTGDTIDHQGGVATETQVLVDSRTEVVAVHQDESLKQAYETYLTLTPVHWHIDCTSIPHRVLCRLALVAKSSL